MHNLPGASRIVCVERQAGRKLRAGRKSKEEAGGHRGHRCHLGGNGGGDGGEDPGFEEATRQALLRLQARQGQEDGTAACQSLLALLAVVQGSGEVLGGRADRGEGAKGRSKGAEEGVEGIAEGSEGAEGEGSGAGEEGVKDVKYLKYF